MWEGNLVRCGTSKILLCLPQYLKQLIHCFFIVQTKHSRSFCCHLSRLKCFVLETFCFGVCLWVFDPFPQGIGVFIQARHSDSVPHADSFLSCCFSTLKKHSAQVTALINSLKCLASRWRWGFIACLISVVLELINHSVVLCIYL